MRCHTISPFSPTINRRISVPSPLKTIDATTALRPQQLEGGSKGQEVKERILIANGSTFDQSHGVQGGETRDLQGAGLAPPNVTSIGEKWGGGSGFRVEKRPVTGLLGASPRCEALKPRTDDSRTKDIVYDANTSLRVTSRYPWACSSSMILGRASAVSWAPTCNTTIAPLHAPSTA